jgi:peptide-methionine (R)-S-oxide reductase
MERRAGRKKYRVLREKERSPHSELTIHYEEGTYCCGACSEPLFESNSSLMHTVAGLLLTIQFLES